MLLKLQIFIIVLSLNLSLILLLITGFWIGTLFCTLRDSWEFLLRNNYSLLICNLSDRARYNCRSFSRNCKICIADSVGILNCWIKVSLCCWIFLTIKIGTLRNTCLYCLTTFSSSAIAFITNLFAWFWWINCLFALVYAWVYHAALVFKLSGSMILYVLGWDIHALSRT